MQTGARHEFPAFFAGISGGLAALNFEIVTSEVVSGYRSGAYLLFTFLGGATFFFGPIIGAVLMVLAFVHAFFPQYFNWKKELQPLILINKQMIDILLL